jgi:diguanylate cyclase (GGDEF)-like protein
VGSTWKEAMALAAQGGGEIPVRDYRIVARDGTLRTMAIGGLVFGKHFLATFVDRTEQQAQSEALRKLAYMDGLTGLANRRHFDTTLQAEWRRCRRSGKPLALVMLDIDHFKLYNDRYGHQQGDEALKAVATALRTGLARPHDLVARYGGEEFVCLLPECDLAGARHKAQALCRAVQALGLEHKGSLVASVVTISAGVASQVPDGDSTPEALLAQADAHLYRAKQRGRNRADDGTGALS